MATPAKYRRADAGSNSQLSAPCRQDWQFHRMRVVFHRGERCAAGESNCADKMEDTCRLIVCLNGTAHVCIEPPAQGGSCEIGAGMCMLLYYPGDGYCRDCPASRDCEVLECSCPAVDWLQLVGHGRLGGELAGAKARGRLLCISQPMTARMDMAANEIRDAAATGAACAPLVMARVFELVWHFQHVRETHGGRLCSRCERRAVQAAKSLLERNLLDPPTLPALASRVGLSLSKLKELFPRVCGMPPYAYLRQVRLEKAMCMLSREGVRVTDAAMEVGYNNLSHFAKSFAAHFGMMPSRVRCRGCGKRQQDPAPDCESGLQR